MELQVAVNSRLSGRMFDLNSITDRLIDPLSGEIDWDHVDESQLTEIDEATLYSKSTQDAWIAMQATGSHCPISAVTQAKKSPLMRPQARLWIGKEELEDGTASMSWWLDSILGSSAMPTGTRCCDGRCNPKGKASSNAPLKSGIYRTFTAWSGSMHG